MEKPCVPTYGVLVGMAVLTLALGFTACNKPVRTQPSSGGDTVRTQPSSGGDTVQTQPSSGGDSAAKSGAAGWEQALNDYEAFVDEYVDFMKKYNANPGDMTMLGKYASMLERAERASDSISEVEDDLSGDDLEKFTKRYMKITEKMTAALQ